MFMGMILKMSLKKIAITFRASSSVFVSLQRVMQMVDDIQHQQQQKQFNFVLHHDEHHNLFCIHNERKTSFYKNGILN